MDTKTIIKPYKKTISRLRVIFFLSTLVIEVFALIPIAVMPRIIDVYVPQKNISMILISLFLFCGIPVAMSLLNTFFQHYIMMGSYRIAFKINNSCFEKLLYQPISFFDESYSTELAHKCSQEAQDLIGYKIFTIPKLISNLIICIVILVLIGLNYWVLALIQLAYLPFLIIPLEATKKPLKNNFADIVDYRGALKKEMQQSFHNIKTIKSLMLEREMLKRAERTQEKILKAQKKSVAIENFVGVWTNNILSWLFQGITFVAAAVFFMYGEITIGALIAVSGYSTRLYSTFFILNRAYMQWGKAQGETEALRTYLSLTDERDDKARVPWIFDSEIVLKNISFAYPHADKQILKDLTIRIPKGQWIGIHGPSGVGKTTILELLLRYYVPDTGSIFVDGKDLQEIRIDEVRNNIAYMSQDSYIFTGTIRENITIGHEFVDEKRLVDAIEISGIHESLLDEEVEREVGESGLALSGGEKKRITLARAVLKDTEILLLDEPTSGLDPNSQQNICIALKALQRERNLTIVSISHQEGFHQFADMIYELRDGHCHQVR